MCHTTAVVDYLFWYCILAMERTKTCKIIVGQLCVYVCVGVDNVDFIY